MTLKDYINYYEIDIRATEAIDYLVECINKDLLFAVEEEDYEEAHRLQQIIEATSDSSLLSSCQLF